MLFIQLNTLSFLRQRCRLLSWTKIQMLLKWSKMKEATSWDHATYLWLRWVWNVINRKINKASWMSRSGLLLNMSNCFLWYAIVSQKSHAIVCFNNVSCDISRYLLYFSRKTLILCTKWKALAWWKQASFVCPPFSDPFNQSQSPVSIKPGALAAINQCLTTLHPTALFVSLRRA